MNNRNDLIGQLRMRDDAEAAQLALAKAQLQASETALEEIRVLLADAARTLRRRTQLRERGLISEAEVDAAVAQVTVSTLNFATFTQVVFAFRVTPDLLFQGIVIALAVGAVGGLAPAIRAARVPISTALRET